jgi:hypothetical protein
MSLTTDQQEQYVAIWAKAVDTQMHFNEMSVKSRQLGLTFVAAALGVGIVLLSRGDAFSFDIPIGGVELKLHVSVLLVLGALVALTAVRQLDLNVYHKMLRGAVTFGEDFEQLYMKQIFMLDKGMTQAISHFSRYADANKTADPNTGRYKYTGQKSVTAEHKIYAFYRNTTWFLVIAAVLLAVFSNAKAIDTVLSRAPSTQVTAPATSSPPSATPPQKDGAVSTEQKNQ